jgi:aminopeptidase N
VANFSTRHQIIRMNRQALETELIHYSSINYEANTRQNALEKLIAFKIINDVVLKNLVNATTHHMWQIRNLVEIT